MHLRLVPLFKPLATHLLSSTLTSTATVMVIGSTVVIAPVSAQAQVPGARSKGSQKSASGSAASGSPSAATSAPNSSTPSGSNSSATVNSPGSAGMQGSGIGIGIGTGAGASIGDVKLSPPVWSNTDTQFFKQYPYLEHNIYHEPDSHFMFGFSVGVLGLVENRLLFTGNFFQVHYQTQQMDWEMLNIAYGMSTANPSNIKSNHFIFRTAPKYRLTRKLAVGPLMGYEFVNFPSVTAVLYKDPAGETQPEPFSSSGMIYGVEATETFPLENGWLVRLTQVGYQETYSTSNAGKGWSYLYADSALRKDASPLKAGSVLELEVGLLF